MQAGIRAAAIAGLVTLLAACGREGDPRLPQGQNDTFPRSYPQGATKTNPENIFRRAGRPD